MRAALLMTVLAMSCAHEELPSARFANKNPVRAVDDRRDVPVPPATRSIDTYLYVFDGSLRDPLVRALDLQPRHRAAGVNALDEVPDSTWFTNRIGVRELTPDEVREGPLASESPELHVPWTVTRTKSEGVTLGLFIEDARGEKFLIKFDNKGMPEIETAAHVIANRLLWASGYNVPEDRIAHVRRSDLVVSPKATRVDSAGRTRRLTHAHLDKLLETIEIRSDGRIRVLASKVVPGRILGGHPGTGVRRDDPNDRIAHELRRDLRGLRALYAWIDNVDVKEQNTLDVWTHDADGGRRYVRHYLIDFGKSFGASGAISHDMRRSHEYAADYPEMFGSFVTLGIKPRPWEGREAPPLVGVGLYEPALDPSRWRPTLPAYQPFLETDRFDWFWGARIILRFTPQQLRAAVDAAQLSHPASAAYLVHALAARQRAIAAYAFSGVLPLDDVVVSDEGALCFDDLAIAQRMAAHATTYYEVTSYDRSGQAFGPKVDFVAGPTGRACTRPLQRSSRHDQYTMWRVRSPGRTGELFVHVARDTITSSLRVIGLWRE